MVTKLTSKESANEKSRKLDQQKETSLRKTVSSALFGSLLTFFVLGFSYIKIVETTLIQSSGILTITLFIMGAFLSSVVSYAILNDAYKSGLGIGFQSSLYYTMYIMLTAIHYETPSETLMLTGFMAIFIIPVGTIGGYIASKFYSKF